ncbi:zinc finger, CCHC-type containing protein [Tanacetum coccineum]|uniref:Zinc finger, CCHC-type containing protein n=1 Tax=Tanacetum coccineum TaxID=301880 RepID=A0ABQ4YKG3_9ASTR
MEMLSVDDISIDLILGHLSIFTVSRPDIIFAYKKQTVVAISTTEAEYVAAASCCGHIYNKSYDAGSHIKNALTECPTLYASLIEQFWQTAALSTNEDEVKGITATIDRKVKVIVSEASIRRPLKLEDSEGLKTLPTAEIFEQLALMGYVITSDSLTFQKGHFSPQWKFFIHTILHCLSPKKTAWEQFSSNIATAIICLATNRTFNFSNLIFEAMVKNIDSRSKFFDCNPLFIQIFLNKRKGMLFPHKKTFPTPTLTQKLFSNMKRASKGYSRVDIPLFPTMLTTPESSPSRITSSPSLSPQTHPSTSQPPSTPQSNQSTPVTEEAAPMPHESSLQSVHLLRRDEGSLLLHELTDLCTSPSKKGRILIEELDLDAGISLVLPHAADQGKIDGYSELVNNLRAFSTGSGGVSTFSRLVSTADISTASELDSIAGVKAKDKGKAIMHESEPPKKIKRRIDFETTLKLQKQLDEREEVAAKVDQAYDIDWSDPAVLRYHTLQNRPFSVAEVRKNMCLYLKNQGGYKMSHFKGMSYEDIRPIFERVWDQNQAFILTESSRTAGGRRKKSLARKRAKETLSEESAKKQKLEDDTEKEELQVYLNIVPEEESLNIESLATKYPIVDWETQILANDKYYYQIKRTDGSVKHYKIFSALLYDFDRQDVLELYRLVKDSFQTASPEVHVLLMDTGLVIHMTVEKKYPLSQGRVSATLAETRVQFHKDQTHLLAVHETQIAVYEAPKLESPKQWFPPETSGLITHATYSCDSQSIFVSFEDGSVAILASPTLTLRCRISSTAYLPNNPLENGAGPSGTTPEMRSLRCKLIDVYTVTFWGNGQGVVVVYAVTYTSRAVVRLPDPKRKTLDKKGIDCIFVGYAEHSKAYRFYVIEPNKSVFIISIIESRDAILPRPNDIIPNLEESQRDDHSDDVPIKGSRDQVGSQYSYCYSIEEDPRTYNEVMQSRDAAFWKEVIDDEIGSIMENNTWILSDLPPGCKPLGFRQKEGIDYFDTYAPVARITTIRLLLALAAIHNLVIHQMDVKTAFLNGDLDEEVYMKQPEGFVMPGNEHKMSRFTSNPSRHHWKAITRVFKHLKWMGILAWGGAISWASKNQTCITGSTMESEFMALTAAGKEAEWLRNLIHEIPIWLKPIVPITI